MMRDMFAAFALLGLLVNQEDGALSIEGHAELADLYAAAAHRLADAMMTASKTN
jgi:hypothetical protein